MPQSFLLRPNLKVLKYLGQVLIVVTLKGFIYNIRKRFQNIENSGEIRN